MEHNPTFLWEVSFSEFLLVTVVLGGGAGWLTGRAIARSWLTNWHLLVYMILLACAVRFIHFSLFEGTLLTAWYYLVDLAVLLIIAFAGKRYTRAGQMGTQYSFAYGRSGPLGWSKRS